MSARASAGGGTAVGFGALASTAAEIFLYGLAAMAVLIAVLMALNAFRRTKPSE